MPMITPPTPVTIAEACEYVTDCSLVCHRLECIVVRVGERESDSVHLIHPCHYHRIDDLSNNGQVLSSIHYDLYRVYGDISYDFTVIDRIICG